MTWSDDNESHEPPMDGLDRLIADAARDYHTPPATVPREAMWAAIVAARPAGAPVVPVAATPAPTDVRSLADARTERDARANRDARRRALWSVAAAAAIFLATGVGIGRWWEGERTASTGQQPAIAERVAAAPVSTVPATPDSADPTDRTARETGAPDAPRTTTLASARPERAEPSSTGRRGGDARANGGADVYEVAMLRHLAKAEALLVSFRSDSVDASMDARLAAWARPLLGDTRLLIDSPAANDPRRRRLLEDLELVLAQVARLAPRTGTVAGAATDSAGPTDRTERQLIDGALRRGQLLPRLRTIVPVGTT